MIRRSVAIGADFPVADMHTVYQWSMIYTDRHPGVAAMDATAEAQRERLQHLGAIGSNAVLVTADTPIMIADTTGRRVTPGRRTEKVDISLHYRISNAVYQKLAKDIETGKLEPEKQIYLDDRPTELDPTLCVIGAAPILAIAKQRGDGGEVIQKLLSAHQVRKRRPGPKAGVEGPKDLSCEITLRILDDEAQRPPLGYGRLATLAARVNVELTRQGYSYKDDSVRKMIARTVREWQAKNPRQWQTRMIASG